jgi:hypothetical protein
VKDFKNFLFSLKKGVVYIKNKNFLLHFKINFEKKIQKIIF